LVTSSLRWSRTCCCWGWAREGDSTEENFAAAMTISLAIGLSLGVILGAAIGAFILYRSVEELRYCQTIAFFHPFCNDGGGGERVLWCALVALHTHFPDIKLAVYTGDTVSDDVIRVKARERFGVTLPLDVSFIRLHHCYLLDAKLYPCFTMVGQALGGALVALEALTRHTPAVFVDTMGSAWTYPIARTLFQCRVACYVHYPTISTDMLEAVRTGRAAHNNAGEIARSSLRTAIKLAYYRLFALAYGVAGQFTSVAMANSTWTQGHMHKLWRRKPTLVFPPCDTTELQRIPLAPRRREPTIISIAQYRPEKDHALQLRAFSTMLQFWPGAHDTAQLVLMGACRNEEDAARVSALRKLSAELGIEDRVQILTDVSYAERQEWLGRAACGLHTMWMEHFGIGVVELMAAGVVPVAHSSGGPLEDIVTAVEGMPSGKLAQTEREYAAAMHQILSMLEVDGREEYAALQRRARAASTRFSDERFAQSFCFAMGPILDQISTEEDAALSPDSRRRRLRRSMARGADPLPQNPAGGNDEPHDGDGVQTHEYRAIDSDEDTDL